MNILINMIIIVCTTINIFILLKDKNKISKLKDENKYWNERVDFYMNDNNRLERYNFELISENIMLKRELNEIKNKEC